MGIWQDRKGLALLLAMLHPEMSLFECAERICRYNRAARKAAKKPISQRAAQAVRTKKFNRLATITEE